MKKVIKLFVFILLASCFYYYSIATKNELIITTEYIYNEETNTVTGIMHANNELKDTKVSWQLDEDKKTYTNTKLKTNGTYTTTVEDIYGNKAEVLIKVELVDDKGPEITMEYIYNEGTNTVTGIMHSNEILKDTKKSWTLSEDKLIYTNNKLTSNGAYTTTVEDKWGNKSKVEIDVKEIDDKGPKITMEYIYNEETNTVTGIMHSNEILKDTKKSWTLSEEKLTYTNNNLTSNGDYTTTVEDRWGNKTNVKIDIKDIDEKGPKITLEYRYDLTDKLVITMNSNEPMKDTKPTWTLSEDKMSYKKSFSDNQNYTTTVEDKWGNKTNVKIAFNKRLSGDKGGGIRVGYIDTLDNKVIVQIISPDKLKDTKPSWTLSEDGYHYTKIFNDDITYSTPVVKENGQEINVLINVNSFCKIVIERGAYGGSGAKQNGIPGGTDLQYYRFGSGENVMFATFCVHGFEDSWSRDGGYLVDIADTFFNQLEASKDKEIANKWTIYVIKEVNPDGRRMGSTNMGEGRRTLYSRAGKGIDINRCWPTEDAYKRYTDSRNYNGTAPFQAYEAEFLRNFLLSRKSSKGQTVLVDLHGWENQLIGNEQIANFYKQQYPSCSTNNYGRYGTQYLVGWARQNLGAKSTLVELPYASSYANANEQRLKEKYIQATMNMLRNV